MTTLIVPLTPALAKQLARVADRCEMTHEEVGREAVRLFVRAYESNGGGKRRAARRPRNGKDGE